MDDGKAAKVGVIWNDGSIYDGSQKAEGLEVLCRSGQLSAALQDDDGLPDIR